MVSVWAFPIAMSLGARLVWFSLIYNARRFIEESARGRFIDFSVTALSRYCHPATEPSTSSCRGEKADWIP